MKYIFEYGKQSSGYDDTIFILVDAETAEKARAKAYETAATLKGESMIPVDADYVGEQLHRDPAKRIIDEDGNELTAREMIEK